MRDFEKISYKQFSKDILHYDLKKVSHEFIDKTEEFATEGRMIND